MTILFLQFLIIWIWKVEQFFPVNFCEFGFENRGSFTVLNRKIVNIDLLLDRLEHHFDSTGCGTEIFRADVIEEASRNV